ncbi:PA14 domain-containing protein [Kitasatospora sp. NPDC101155]|uniref:PA14 domain-containing protein n=1 Tax=Kitasatospora sp. NPDC101155 TaxID=3364097 RepID=UPI00381A611F
MAHAGKLKALVATAATAALSFALLGAEAPAASGSGSHGDATRVGWLPAAEGAPDQPAWPDGVFGEASGPALDGGPATAPAGPVDGATLADPRPELAATGQSAASAYEFVIGTGDSPRTGQVTSSGWIDSPRWQVPAGLLKDGGRYRWTVRTKDRAGRVGADAPARSFAVNQRLGAQPPGGPVPTDTLGPVTVNLSTGNVTASVNTAQVHTGSGVLGATFSYNSQAVGTAAGLTGSYYAGDSDTGIAAGEKAAAVRTDARVDFRWGTQAPYPGAAPDATFRARWAGQLRVPADGRYRLGGTYDGGLRILVDGRPVLDDWQRATATGDQAVYGQELRLKAGQTYDIKVEYRRRAGGGQAGLWVSGGGHAVPVPASWLQPAGAVLPPGWTVTPAATGPDTAGAANVAAARGGSPSTAASAGSSGAAPGQAGPDNAAVPDKAAVPGSAKAKAKTTSGDGASGAAESATSPEGAAARIAAAENDGLTFRYAGSAECAGSAAPAGYVCAVVVPGAGTTQLFYRNGKLTRVVNPGGDTTDFGFTADHRLSVVRPPLVMDWIAVDPSRRDTEAAQYRIDYQRDSATAARVTAPDPAGATGQPDRRPEHGYSVASGATEVRVAGVGTPQGWTRKVTYDTAGRLAGDSDGTGRTTRYVWTATDQPASVTDAAGRMTTTVYNEAGLPAGSYGPGPQKCFGSDLRPFDPAPEGCDKVPAQTTSYGPTGTTTERADSDGVPQQTVETQLNEFGLPVATVADPKGLALKTGYEFDGSFRPVSKTLPTGSKETFAYYGASESAENPCTPGSGPVPQRGLPKATTLPAPVTGSPRVEKFVWDARGLPVAVTNGAADWTCVSYDARGRMTGTFVPKDANAPARTVRFDLAVGGDPLRASASDPLGTIEFTTDLLGRTARYTDTYGVRTDTTYDRAGRIVQERTTPPVGADAPQVKTVQYDAAGRVTTVSFGATMLATARYDEGGDIAGATYANGTRLDVGRDPEGRTVAKNWTLADGRTLSGTVTRSRSGTVVKESTAGEDPRPDGPDYRYDAVGRLTDAWVTGHHFTYDFTSPAPAACPAGTSANAGANGNRVRLLDRTESGTAETGYCYDGSDRLLATTGAQVLGDTTYNVAGTLSGYTLDGTPMSQRYDAAERYIGKSAGGSDPVDVTYPNDLLDRQAGRTVTEGADTETLLYSYTSAADHNVDLVLRGDRRLLTRTVALPGGVLYVAKAAAYSGQDTWNLSTVRGDVFLVTDDDGGQVGDVYRYAPYGEPLCPDGTIDSKHVPDNLPGENGYAWLGQYEIRYEHAGSVSAYDLQTRTLEPATGRFTGPVTQGPFANPYDYGTGDPINHASTDGVGLNKEMKS